MEKYYQKLTRKVRAYLLRERRKKSLMGQCIDVEKHLHPMYWKWERDSVARGAFWGGFWCIMPVPLQTLFAVVFCVWRRGNIPMGVLFAWLSPPGSWLLVVPAQWWVGAKLADLMGLEGSGATWETVESAISLFMEERSMEGFLSFNYAWFIPEFVVGMCLTCFGLAWLLYASVHLLWRVFQKNDT